jgi:hypothetical protein
MTKLIAAFRNFANSPIRAKHSSPAELLTFSEEGLGVLDIPIIAVQ